MTPLRINIFDRFKYCYNRAVIAVRMVFEMFKNIDVNFFLVLVLKRVFVVPCYGTFINKDQKQITFSFKYLYLH